MKTTTGTATTIEARVVSAFQALQYDGWFARSNYGCCPKHAFAKAVAEKGQADAYAFVLKDDVKECFNRTTGTLNRPLPIFFAAGRPNTFDSDESAGRHLQATLEVNGLSTTWDGNPNAAIDITGLKVVS